MATYTVTIVITRPDSITDWPQVAHPGGAVNVVGVKLISITDTFSDDNLTQTKVCVWKSKDDFESAKENDAAKATIGDARRTYMALNDMTCTITEEDGTVLVFNKSNETFEEQE